MPPPGGHCQDGETRGVTVGLHWTRTEEFLEERRRIRKLGVQIAPNLCHRSLGKQQTKEAEFTEDQDCVAGARSGQQPGDQDISIDANKDWFSLLGRGHPGLSGKASALDAVVPSRPPAAGRRAGEG